MKRALRERRVRALVRAAGVLADPATEPGQAIRAALLAQGPLSEQAVELALRHHLPRDPSSSEMDSLIASAGDARYVHVVLSSNVFVGAVGALAMAVAAAPRVTVRMSRRESVFAQGLLAQIDDPDFGDPIEISESLRPSWIEQDATEVHLYGRNATMVQLAASLPEGVWVRAHGAGMGVVAVGASADLEQTAEAIAADVIPFDQRGCLSPRVVLVEGAERGAALGQSIARVLSREAEAVPMGRLLPEELEERTRYRNICRMTGEFWEAGEGSVGVGEGIWVPPVGRNVHVVACDLSRVTAVLSPVRSAVAALGVAGAVTDPLVCAVVVLLPCARVSPVGSMQRPVLDGFVDGRLPERLRPVQVVEAFSSR